LTKSLFMSESTDNYLKTIFSLTNQTGKHVTTTELSEKMNTKASSVTDMLKKLHARGLAQHTRYRGVSLTQEGTKEALDIVRRHRIWEVFLYEKLGFKWNEVHDIAEQLEHVTSTELITRLEAYLNNPKFDPHGDPIPDKTGKMPKSSKSVALYKLKAGEACSIVSVDDSSSALLEHLENLKIGLGSELKIKKVNGFDGSMEVIVKSKTRTLSHQVAASILVNKTN
jgi:DtxR family Mn-dependent transcriptional regulator